MTASRLGHPVSVLGDVLNALSATPVSRSTSLQGAVLGNHQGWGSRGKYVSDRKGGVNLKVVVNLVSSSPVPLRRAHPSHITAEPIPNLRAHHVETESINARVGTYCSAPGIEPSGRGVVLNAIFQQ